MAKPKEMGICPICTYGGDTTPKELQSSHVVPRNTYKALREKMGPKLKGRYIEMHSEPDIRLDVTQDQGDTPMLCWDCEQQLSVEIEKPTRVWIRKQISGPLVDVDSVLLARYVASVWWRGMLSKHERYNAIGFDPVIIRPLIEASLNPDLTYKKMSFRLRKLIDSSGGFSETALLQYTAMVPNHLAHEKSKRRHACFALIHDGYVWEVFVPRLSSHKINKLNFFKPNRDRYILKSLDFFKNPALKEHAIQVYSKHVGGQTTPAFRKALPSSEK
jgi:hypothetical protein